MDDLHNHEGTGHLGSRWKWALAGFLALAAFFLWTEHRAHMLGVLPSLLILACPLLHFFHHGRPRHGPDRHDGSDRADRQRQVRTSGEQP